MTWEELCKKAKEIGYFNEDSSYSLENPNIIAENRTPEQMFIIMKALQ